MQIDIASNVNDENASRGREGRDVASVTVQRPAANLGELPYEILRLIMSYLDVGHIICLSGVSTVIRYRILADDLFWQQRLGSERVSEQGEVAESSGIID